MPRCGLTNGTRLPLVLKSTGKVLGSQIAMDLRQSSGLRKRGRANFSIRPAPFELEGLADIFESAQEMPPSVGCGDGLARSSPESTWEMLGTGSAKTPRQQTLERHIAARYSCSGASIDNSQLWLSGRTISPVAPSLSHATFTFLLTFDEGGGSTL